MTLITGAVRTGVQVLIAALLTWLASLGIDISPDIAMGFEAGVFAVATGLVTAAVNWLGQKWPTINKIISLGLADTGPDYPRN